MRCSAGAKRGAMRVIAACLLLHCVAAVAGTTYSHSCLLRPCVLTTPLLRPWTVRVAVRGLQSGGPAPAAGPDQCVGPSPPCPCGSPADLRACTALPGFTRSGYYTDHALITPESRVYAGLFGWCGCDSPLPPPPAAASLTPRVSGATPRARCWCRPRRLARTSL